MTNSLAQQAIDEVWTKETYGKWAQALLRTKLENQMRIEDFGDIENFVNRMNIDNLKKNESLCPSRY
ncbi:MAG: hypothetical protein EAY75_17215 [Bacteroidetes bacterium]|nr:MAG: hypothetical protein EAY75_17215 [Bacteroidota bacterium]